MVCKGDYVQCPQCTRRGRIVWVSENGKVMGIQCSASHRLDNLPNIQGFSHHPSKAHKNSVFLVNTQPTISTNDMKGT
jgi:hypothetical protein